VLVCVCPARPSGLPAKVRQLVNWASAGDVARVVALLEGPDPLPIDAKDTYGYTALCAL
jgi:hypothetical protein